MNEKIFLDMLSQYGVSIKKQKVTIIDGTEYIIGNPWRKAYVNSTKGRVEVEVEVSEPYKSAIMSMWGDTPTVTEKTDI